MDANTRRRIAPFFGRVTARRLGSKLVGSLRGTTRQDRLNCFRYTWRPSPLIRSEVVTAVPLALDCVSVGRRRMFRVPAELGPHAWILLASVGGHAILNCLHSATCEQRSSFHPMRLIYQLAPRMREHLGRGFRRLDDLYIPRPARVGGEVNVLPDDMGLSAAGQGHSWTVRQLAAAGREAAADIGIAYPTDEDIIRLGIWAAAQKRPIDASRMSVDEATALVRLGIFDFGPANEAVDPAVADEVVGRLVDALKKHQDDTTEQFHQWFLEEFDNIVHQIAKRKRPSGEIERSVVRQAILEWVFRSLRYVGNCVHLQARAFANACQPRLSRPERAIFSALYERQPYLGDMPLILLHQQLPFAREALDELMNNPTDLCRAGVLLRVLQFHAEMVRRKRESERRYKRQGQHRNRHNSSAARISLDRVSEIAAAARTQQFQEIAAELRERRAAKCACRTTAGWFAEVDESKSKGSHIVIIDCCTDCGHREECATTAEEISRIESYL